MYSYQFEPLADKAAILAHFKGKSTSELPTPAFTVDRALFAKNAKHMRDLAKNLKCDFRAHVKTHKTVEGTVLQLGDSVDKVIVSTLAEAWSLVKLCEEGKINDLLFSLPVLGSRLDELAEFSKHVKHLRLMLDNVEQVKVLEDYSKQTGQKWSVFVKINMGSNRAGFVPADLEEALKVILKSGIDLYGFYAHCGHSYTSKSEEQCESFLEQELKSVNEACKLALSIDPSLKLQMSVGATPTAHSSELLNISKMGELYGNPELHAGNYPFCDLQQVATGCVGTESISIRVLADVVSCYPGRGKGPGESLCDAGVLAMSKETGQIPGFGWIDGHPNWMLGRLSQEHGILTVIDESKDAELIPIGSRLSIIPQHSCITAAQFAWYYVLENDKVVDIWVPYRGW